MFSIFLQGIFLGFGLVIPLGPQNVFIFQRAAIQEKIFEIWPILLVTILCDAFLITSAVVGVNSLEALLPWKSILTLVGGCFLFYLSWMMWKNSTRVEWNSSVKNLNRWQQIFYILTISLINPHAILDIFLVIGTFSSKYSGNEKHAFALGCIIIDVVWFLALALAGFYIKKIRNGNRVLCITNRVSAIIMLLIALNLFSQTIFN